MKVYQFMRELTIVVVIEREREEREKTVKILQFLLQEMFRTTVGLRGFLSPKIALCPPTNCTKCCNMWNVDSTAPIN